MDVTQSSASNAASNYKITVAKPDTSSPVESTLLQMKNLAGVKDSATVVSSSPSISGGFLRVKHESEINSKPNVSDIKREAKLEVGACDLTTKTASTNEVVDVKKVKMEAAAATDLTMRTLKQVNKKIFQG